LIIILQIFKILILTKWVAVQELHRMMRGEGEEVKTRLLRSKWSQLASRLSKKFKRRRNQLKLKE